MLIRQTYPDFNGLKARLNVLEVILELFSLYLALPPEVETVLSLSTNLGPLVDVCQDFVFVFADVVPFGLELVTCTHVFHPVA